MPQDQTVAELIPQQYVYHKEQYSWSTVVAPRDDHICEEPVTFTFPAEPPCLHRQEQREAPAWCPSQSV